MTADELKRWKARGGRGPKIITVHGVLPDGFQVLDPATMAYRAALQPDTAVHDCAGCVFHRQEAKVCQQAVRLAVKAELHDCDDVDPETGRGYVYVLRELDPRQLSIMEDTDEPS